jgi:hypothetical protein
MRGLFPGLTYQLGNLISASAAQVESVLGQRLALPDGRPNYGLVQAILIAIVFGAIIILVLLGKEARGIEFSPPDETVRVTSEDSSGNTDSRGEPIKKSERDWLILPNHSDV